MGEPPLSRPGYARLGEDGLLVLFPNSISSRINRYIHALRRALLDRAIDGVVDIVPAYTTLLIRFDPENATHDSLEVAVAETLRDMPPDAGSSTRGNSRTHVIPVQYGGDYGPDFANVAHRHNLTHNDLIRLHTSRPYTVGFLGFLPGFAYLGKLARRLETPRLATPRSRVEGGSVGIAGLQTAVYPFASPGGWQILGRTSLAVWDPISQPPALFAPGDRVRFAQSDFEPPRPTGSDVPPAPRMPVFEVVSAGGLTTIQDIGRPGLAHLGVAQGGAFDGAAATRTNALVGNSADAAVLEMTWSGPALLALRSATIALEGADLGCIVDGVRVPPGISWFVRRGSLVRFSATGAGRNGVRGYLAVAGGFDVPLVLGSRATSMLAHFGGYCGRPLRAGDVLGVGEGGGSADSGLLAGRSWSDSMPALPGDHCVLRYIAYRGRGAVSKVSRRAFRKTQFVLTERADRMGYRFESEDGSALPPSSGELISFGVVRGTIQVPPDGRPVILNVDHQTTGGYPIVGVVVRADWPLLAQLSPGTSVRFEEITLEEAALARGHASTRLQEGLISLGVEAGALRSENYW